jgi:PIN domain nuclease of toxin-antitoxin system
LVFWYTQESVSTEFIKFFDKQNDLGNIFISSISFWELALLNKRGKIEIGDLESWKNELLSNTNLVLLEPTASEMIQSVQLPDHHKDPFDRLLIIQTKINNALLVSRDKNISKYEIPMFWI